MTAQPPTTCLLTPPGRGGIAVIALAGAGHRRILDRLFRPRTGQVHHHAAAAPGTIQLGKLLAGPDVIDEALLTLTPHAAEINIHGSPISVRRTLERLAELGASVSATPDEPILLPTHPRWDNPAIGTELLDTLPRAQTPFVAALLAGQFSDGLSRLLSETLAELSASPPPPPERLAQRAEDLQHAADGWSTVRRLLDPPEIVLAGAPNVGKSTLANALLGRSVSIVHDTPGTTRDWVRSRAVLNGVPVWLTDTAGLWEDPQAPIDAEAVRRSWQRIASADLVLLAIAGPEPRLPEHPRLRRLLRLATRIDKIPPSPNTDAAVSALTGEGMDELPAAILHRLGLDALKPDQPTAFTPRQAELLAKAAKNIQSGQSPASISIIRNLLTNKPL